jgi:hypothetical protein
MYYFLNPKSKILLGALSCRGTRTVRASAKSKIPTLLLLLALGVGSWELGG